MRKLLIDCTFLVAIAAILFFAISAVSAPPVEEYSTSITYKGLLKTVITIPATVNGKIVEINIVNGFVPDQILEGKTEGKITIHTFIFRHGTPYDKNKKYEYVHEKKGFVITESRQKLGNERKVSEHTSEIYMLKK